MQAGKRRLAQGLTGGVLLVATIATMYNMGVSAYYNYYLYPKVKEGYIMPLRWQDIVFLVIFWSIAIALFYVSCRLLKAAFRPRISATD
jgi:hypothetical protein